MHGQLAGGGNIYDGYCSQCGELERRVERLEMNLAAEERAKFIGPIQEFKRLTFADALKKIYMDRIAEVE